MRIDEDQPTIRTQISLTPSIKRAIEAKRRLTGESLSAYLRKAALIRLLAEEEEEEDLKRLAKAVIGSVSLKNHPEWSTKTRIRCWLKALRKEWE